jgi:hypothetical protein
MASPYETLEKAEETTHVRSKHIGLTMALIGVLIAFCAAMVGSQRNELTRTMIEQTQAHSDYSSASTKFRIVMIELERLRGASSAPLSDAPNASQLPGLKRFLRLYLDYSKERTFAKTWADSYQPEIDAHFGAAESYEKAQLVAEIGIVIASLAVLLSNRLAWIVSIVFAALCVAMLGKTSLATRNTVIQTTDAIRQTEHAYKELRKAHLAANEDETTVDQLDPGAKIRAELQGEYQKTTGE